MSSFAGLTNKRFSTAITTHTDDPLDAFPALRPVSIDVAHASDPRRSDVSAMFNGWPATHSDVLAGLTFERTVSEELSAFLKGGEVLAVALLGASGVGKTTAGRQVLQRLRREGFLCWEHKTDLTLLPEHWVGVAMHCRDKNIFGILMVDDAHTHLSSENTVSSYAASMESSD